MYLTLCNLIVEPIILWGLGFSESIKTHPCVPYFIQSALEGIESVTSIMCWFKALYSARKKDVFSTFLLSLTHPSFTNFRV